MLEAEAPRPRRDTRSLAERRPSASLARESRTASSGSRSLDCHSSSYYAKEKSLDQMLLVFVKLCPSRNKAKQSVFESKSVIENHALVTTSWWLSGLHPVTQSLFERHQFLFSVAENYGGPNIYPGHKRPGEMCESRPFRRRRVISQPGEIIL